jgi:hypothetical protein
LVAVPSWVPDTRKDSRLTVGRTSASSLRPDFWLQLQPVLFGPTSGYSFSQFTSARLLVTTSASSLRPDFWLQLQPVNFGPTSGYNFSQFTSARRLVTTSANSLRPDFWLHTSASSIQPDFRLTLAGLLDAQVQYLYQAN